MSSIDPQKFAQELEDHLTGHILPFWCGPALDSERGGWMSWLSNDLKPDRTQPRGLIVNARILWAFSAAYQAHPLQEYEAMARRAFDVLTGHFWDHEQGGAFWRLSDDWSMVDDSKKTYGQAFCIYALSESFKAFGNVEALDLAKRVFGLIEEYAWDKEHRGYIEVCNRDWSQAGSEARLSEKDMNEKKSMNNHLHVLEAFTNLHRVWKSDQLIKRLHDLLELFETRILEPQTMHLHHFFDDQWNVRSNSYTFGHDIEASWLLCEAVEALADQALVNRVRSTAAKMADVTLAEGIDADGALRYEGKHGQIIDAGRECWPQAEAMVGFINAYQLTGDSKYLLAAHRAWSFIQNHLVDRTHGEWFWRTDPDGKPDPSLPKVSEWKGPYHATRACLEGSRRLRTPAAP